MHDQTPAAPPRPSAPQETQGLEGRLERLFFGARWICAPLYFGLTAGLLVIVVKFLQTAWALVRNSYTLEFDDVFVGILDMIDLVLLANLLLIVMFAGYENFVSKLDVRSHRDFPDWIGHVTFGDIKIKLMASIVAMSAIHVLADFIRVNDISSRTLAWSVGIHLAFVVSGLMLALMDRMMETPSGQGHTNTRPEQH
ncbi:TIGR00645 family protein [Komagataeibacter kakiaceti JCM 25156]|uniref:TIGR00645 family protein n=1 Tax=Komagataeibacter kakiaceti TaxID=943261 RepID=UPI00047259FE|nr:TIGR00645 family protein [Komagataeibacter kakiaceti]